MASCADDLAVVTQSFPRKPSLNSQPRVTLGAVSLADVCGVAGVCDLTKVARYVFFKLFLFLQTKLLTKQVKVQL